MELRTCEFCGTEYGLDQQSCPACGRGEHQQPQPEKQKRRLASSGGGARVAKKKEQKKSSRLGWGIACIVLGAAVLVGIGYFFSIMSFFEPGFDFNAIPTLIQQGEVPEEDLSVRPRPEEEPEQEPEEVPEEAQPAAPVVDPNSKACTGLTISQSAVTMDEQGGRIFLTAVARPSSCEDEIIFRSTDESVVTVTENGMITAVAPGVADIIVSCGTITQVCTITCDFEVVSEEEEPKEQEPEEQEPEDQKPDEQEPEEDNAPALDKTDFTLFYPGEKTKLVVNNAPEGAAVSYVSSNTKVVTVDANGNVTAEGDGDATITVTVGDVQLTCIARCRLDSSAEGGVTGSFTGPFKLSHEDVTLFSSGETFQLSLIDANGKAVTNLTWTATNGCVTISGSTIKAAATGQTTVSCVYDGTTYKCIVRCNF